MAIQNLVTAVSLLLFCFPAIAESNYEQVIKEAIQGTQQVLSDPTARDKVIQESPGAKAADAQVNSIAGSPERSQKIYELAAEIFSTLMLRSNGDADAMAKMLQNLEKNPSAIEPMLTQEQIQKIHTIAKDITPPGPASQKLP